MKHSFVYSLLLIGLLSACGRPPQAVNVPTPKPKVGDVLLTEQYAADNLKDYSMWLASTVVNSIRGSVFEKVPESVPGGLMAQQSSSVCGFEPGKFNDYQDNDGDGVEANFRRTFVNCEQDKGNYIELKNGQIWIQDADDKKAESGFKSVATDLTFDFFDKFSSVQRDQQLKLQDTWEFTIEKSEGKSGSLAYVLTLVGTGYENNSALTAVKGTLALAGEYTAVADSNGSFDSNDYDNGIIDNASGELIMNGAAAFNATLEALTFSDSCQATPVSGAMILGDGTNTFRIDFDGCEAMTYSLNGTTVFAPAPESAQ